MKKLILVWILFPLYFAAANPVNVSSAPADFATEQCREFLEPVRLELMQFFQNYEDLYKKLIRRLGVENDPVKLAHFKGLFFDIASDYVKLKPLLLTSKRVPMKDVERLFLPGIAIWARSMNDVTSVTRMLRKHLDVTDATNNRCLTLEYFVARMAWAGSLIPYRSQAEIFKDVARFDTTNHRELMLTWYHSEFEAREAEPGPDEMELAAELRVKYFDHNHAPAPLRHLRFNNNRIFHFFSVGGDDKWMAKHLSKAHPEEWILGLGDTSVRQFFHLVRMSPSGIVTRFPFAPDLLSVGPSIASMQSGMQKGYSLRIREMKFSFPTVREVDVPKALEQLESGWLGTIEGGLGLPVEILEIVLPQRARNVHGDLGNGYRIGPQFFTQGGGKVSYLQHNDGTNWVNHEMAVNGTTLPVYVREIPISDDEFKRIANR